MKIEYVRTKTCVRADKKLKEFRMAKRCLVHSVLGIALVFAFFLGSCNLVINDTFVPVTNIIGVPTTALAGTPLALTGTVMPWDATNKTIVWTVKSAETTGAVISGNSLITTAAGTATVTAMVVNGSTASSSYTKDFPITVKANDPVYVPVTGVTDVPTIAIMGEPLTLRGTVEPANATNKTIVWSGNGVSNGVLTAASAGSVTVTAEIAKGASESSPYTKNFTITVYDAGTDDGTNPFGTDAVPNIWAMDDTEGWVYVKITENSWVATDGGAIYNSGNYSLIGKNAAQWTVTEGSYGGDTGLAIIEGGKIIVANFWDKFSSMNGTFTKLDTTLTLTGTWKTSEPSYNGNYYIKIVAGSGNFTKSISPDDFAWKELIKGTYPTAPNTNPAACTITHVNTGVFTNDTVTWVAWSDLDQQYKYMVGGSETQTVIIYSDRIETIGLILLK